MPCRHPSKILTTDSTAEEIEKAREKYSSNYYAWIKMRMKRLAPEFDAGRTLRILITVHFADHEDSAHHFYAGRYSCVRDNAAKELRRKLKEFCRSVLEREDWPRTSDARTKIRFGRVETIGWNARPD